MVGKVSKVSTLLCAYVVASVSAHGIFTKPLSRARLSEISDWEKDGVLFCRTVFGTVTFYARLAADLVTACSDDNHQRAHAACGTTWSHLPRKPSICRAWYQVAMTRCSPCP